MFPVSCQFTGFPTIRMCSGDGNFNNNLFLTGSRDENSTQECVCQVTRRVQANISFINNQFTCPDAGSWKLEFYNEIGCLEDAFDCNILTDTSQTFRIPSSSSANEIYVKLGRSVPDATDVGFNWTVAAVAAVPCM